MGKIAIFSDTKYLILRSCDIANNFCYGETGEKDLFPLLLYLSHPQFWSFFFSSECELTPQLA